MAWATKCDRCGNYFDWEDNEISGFAFLTYDRIKDKYYIKNDAYDLCPKCVKDLYDWLDRKEES